MKEYKVIYKNRDYTILADKVSFNNGMIFFTKSAIDDTWTVAIFPIESIVIEKGHGDIN